METEAQFGVFSDLFKVLVFDNRGSGQSDKKRPYTHKQWVQDVEELR
jgi:pimeloyl-ACP methyl ester carboxylesterase